MAISSRSVAIIIRKTIQRKQNGIRQLNQGLQSVSFGRPPACGLNVNVREAHSTLLDVFLNSMSSIGIRSTVTA
ncbi:hypothetical protein ACNKHS_05435 [Shigella flexneri]